ncbi:hypothetical protein [Streptomyces mangrovisoli]|uniref:ATP-binding protein n=1 Tax=Streptomyces mangrovisoli TaxID=1428628 RepID=A0A1J4NRR6_9ACTN|nr:hypothetical protein [Streptomyces mangrovisoli]OIJ65079.1 hypothetical protein WN71_025025 [Streptomyces mangrovisoli]
MARHASSPHPTAQRALVALATASVALGAGATAASAATAPIVEVPSRPTSLGQIDPQNGLAALTGSVRYITGPVAGLKPNPLAGTGVDPLDNGLGTQIADFQPIATRTLTAPLAEAPSLGSVPVLGQVLGATGA